MFKKFRTNINKGFSLIELLIYMGFFSIFLAMILQMFSSIIGIQLESQSSSALSGDGQYIINRFAYDLRRAQSITTPALGASSQTLALVINNQTFTYNLDNGNLILDVNSAKDQLNSYQATLSNISFLRLEGRDGKDVIQVSFTIHPQVSQNLAGENFQVAVGLR